MNSVLHFWLESDFWALSNQSNSSIDRWVSEIELPAPVRQRLPLSFILYNQIRSSVVRLLRFCSPSTVYRFVIAVIVFSVQRMCCRRFFTHIFEECVKIIPSFANRNTATSVPLVVRMIWISATCQHLAPHRVHWVSRMSVNEHLRSKEFRPKAAARIGYSFYQSSCCDRFFSAAVTSAQPSCFAADVGPEVSSDCEPSEGLSNQITKSVVFGNGNGYEFLSVIHGASCVSLEAGSGDNQTGFVHLETVHSV